MVFPSENGKRQLPTVLVIALIIACFLTGGLLGNMISYYSNSEKIASLETQLVTVNDQLSTAQTHLDLLQNSFQTSIADFQNTPSQNMTDIVVDLQNQLSAIQDEIGKLQLKSAEPNQNVTELKNKLNLLQNQLSALQQQITHIRETAQSPPAVINQNTLYLYGENFSLSSLFEQVKESVVIVQGLVRQVDFFGRIYYSTVQGSGFLYDYTETTLIFTNNHVISDAINITVTFTTGEVFPVTLLGANPDNDFAVLSINGSKNDYKPLEVISSATLKVGDPVIVVGTPYGLEGSMSNGIVSALNRTLTTSTQSTITGVIQTTAPLNPGNSGGPVMNYRGQVVGIATAIVQESQGIGFAVPSDTLLKDLAQIVPKQP